jgi:prophage tail gpP-like protein
VWQAKYNAARSTQARLIVPGWRHSDGSLWRINPLVTVRAPFLSLDMELLIASVSYMLNAYRSRHTERTVGSVDGYQPDPGQVRLRRHRKNQHKGGAGRTSSPPATAFINEHAGTRQHVGADRPATGHRWPR